MNSSTGASGGAIALLSGSAVVQSSTFYLNSATNGQGGAIYAGAGSLTLVNSTISDNSSGWGAITGYPLSDTSDADIKIINSTITGNSSNGIYQLRGTLNVYNSILSGNGTNCGSQDISGSCPTNGTNGNVVVADANLLPIGLYGGTNWTYTRLLLPGSKAICAGSSSYLATSYTGLSAAITTDQRGFALDPSCTTSGAIDAGAVQTNQYVVTTNDDSNDGSCTSSLCSLRDAITAANAASGDITFASGLSGETITLGTNTSTGDIALPSITGTANLLGPGASLLSISGNSDAQVDIVLTVDNDATVFLYMG